jgi:2-hydroxychromene-2-carboxylate isomerase
MMTKDRTVHFYFDFLSPFGYFGSLRIDDLAAAHGFQVEWHPMLLGISVMKVMGLPPIAELPLKGAYIRHDAARYARRHGIKIGKPAGSPQISPLVPARTVCWLKEHQPEMVKPLASAIYDAHWSRNADYSDVGTVMTMLKELGGDAEGAREGLESGEAAASLREEVDSSIAAGVFGSPTFRVGDELFFGVEKLEVLDDWLRTGGW